MLNYKKDQKELYMPKAIPSVIDVPEMLFITVDGKGDPNNSEEYEIALKILYGLSYSIKMGNKSILEYVVPPLEGFWNVDGDFKGGGNPIKDKSKFIWTMMIRQPDFVTTEIFNIAIESLSKKKPELNLSLAQLTKITEGLCVQMMHLGSYDDEPETITAIDNYALENGYLPDMAGHRRHHEIYISDPRKTSPEKLKTVIRHPVKNK